ncbi:EAL domain-containing protein [Acidovorax lacteus]
MSALAPLPLRQTQWLALMAVAALWLAALGYTLWRLHDQAVENAQAQAELHVRNFETHITQALQIIDLAAAGLDSALDAPPDPAALQRHLLSVLRPTSFIRSISVVDDTGRIVASSDSANLGVQLPLDHFYPPTLSDLLRIGVPWRGRDFHNGEEGPFDDATPGFVPVLRGIPSRSGSMALLVTLHPDFFAHHTRQQLDEAVGHTQWLRYDGQPLFRSRSLPAALADALDTTITMRLQQTEQGRVTLPGGQAAPMLSAFRASPQFPVVVATHLDHAQVLAAWRQEAQRLALVVLPMVATLLLLGVLALRRQQRVAAKQAELREERRLTSSVFHASNDAIIVTSASADILSVNPAFERITGYSANEVRGCNPRMLSSGQQDQAFYARMWQRLLATGFWQGELVNRHRDGSHYVCHMTISAVQDDQGHLSHYVGVARDITVHQAAEKRLQLAASVFSHAHEGIMITNADGVLVDVNEAFSRITGYAREEVLGQTPRMLSSGRQPRSFYERMWSELRTVGAWSGEVWNRRKSGEVYAEMLHISAVADSNGQLSHYVALFSDITQNKEQERRLERIAHYDALTGLPNRVLLGERLRRSMQQMQRLRSTLAVVFLDLDGFKAINDQHGHDAGDHLLVALAGRMSHALREEDTIARLGGDEFVAVLSHLHTVQDCIPVIERLLRAISDPVVVEGVTLQVTGSLGVAFYPQADEVDADQLLRQADQAMYQAKVAGKNRYQVFDVEQDRTLRGRHESLERIQQGLDDHEFELYFQPKVNMRSGEVLGVEALLRWNHPEHGLLPPGTFLDVIGDHPLHLQLGEWVIEQALVQIVEWKRAGLHMPVSVNVDGRQLQHPEFMTRLQALLARHPQVQRGDLGLEVLESSALSDIPHVSGVIDACESLGVDFALDDFGTGYSSLTYLRRLPARVLKIDKSFVQGMLEDPEDLSILEGVLGLARAFRRAVVAEGVESIAHGQMLLRMGCEGAQGYAIARPMPARALPVWLAQWRPDARWLGQRTCSGDELPVLFAVVEHRAWTDAVHAYVTGERDTPPSLDASACRLAHWIANSHGSASPNRQRVLLDIAAAHDHTHAVARRICALRASGRSGEARALCDALGAASLHLQQALDRWLEPAHPGASSPSASWFAPAVAEDPHGTPCPLN